MGKNNPTPGMTLPTVRVFQRFKSSIVLFCVEGKDSSKDDQKDSQREERVIKMEPDELCRVVPAFGVQDGKDSPKDGQEYSKDHEAAVGLEPTVLTHHGHSL